MAGLICVAATALFVLVCFWDVVSVAFVPIAVCGIAYTVALFLGHIEPTLNKKRNVVVIVSASLFLVLSVCFSLIFPSDMASGDHFRNIIPFLKVTFY